MNPKVKQLMDWCDQKGSRYFTRRDVERVTGLEGDRLDGFFAVKELEGSIEPCGGAWWRFAQAWLETVNWAHGKPLTMGFVATEQVGMAVANASAVAKANFNVGDKVYATSDGLLTTMKTAK